MKRSADWLNGLIALVMLALVVPAQVDAYSVRVSWRPVPGAAGYKLYVREGTAPYGAGVDLGAPAAGSDGSIRYTRPGLHIESTNTFSVTSYENGVESPHSNELSIPYATAAQVVDSDVDGLTDAREDTNLNLTIDGRETDRLRADTDGDGASDGAEVAAGTDPLSAASRPGAPSATATPIPATRTATPNASATPTRTAMPSRTATPTRIATPIRTATPTRTTTPTRTATPIRTDTPTPVPTATKTATPSASATATSSLTATPAPTRTPLPPAPTATPLDSVELPPPQILSVQRVD